MRSVPFIIVWMLAVTAQARAQIPDQFTNLKMLPSDIDRRELIGTMRDFSSSLGVRCEFCHVGEGGPSLANMDFASDAKEPKRAARSMLAMVRAINDEHLGRLETRIATRVDCFTCHHGLSRPGRIETEVEAALGLEGVQAAVSRYRELKKEHYGSSAYDFSVGPLNDLGESLLRQGKTAEALAALELNAEFFPDSSWLQHLLGEAHLAAGDRNEAKGAFERSLALDPSNEMAKKRLEELRSNPK